ncbi:hypothetical protein PSPO01_05303 [Paraphaeosphaeria sporulosa]
MHRCWREHATHETTWKPARQGLLLPLGSAAVRPSPSTCMQTARFPWALTVVICTLFVSTAARHLSF